MDIFRGNCKIYRFYQYPFQVPPYYVNISLRYLFLYHVIQCRILKNDPLLSEEHIEKIDSLTQLLGGEITPPREDENGKYEYKSSSNNIVTDKTKLLGTRMDSVMFNVYQYLDEQFGSGDFDQNYTMTVNVEQHMTSSVESLIRLYIREKTFVDDLRKVGFRNHLVRQPTFPEDIQDFIAGASVGQFSRI